MRLSPTAVLKYETCPRRYFLEELWRVRTVHTPANLVFGRTVHTVIERWLRGWLTGLTPDAVRLFEEHWRQAREAGGIEYSSVQSPESLAATGRALVARFATAWPEFGLMPVLDLRDEPIIERKLEVALAPGLVYAGRLDLLVLDGAGRLLCLDLKTPASATDPDWLAASDQLSGYQLLLDAHAERLGLPPVERFGLLELLKRKVPTRRGKGPEVCPPITVARRDPAELEAYRRKVLWVAEDIHRQRFPKRGLMAHNSPCGLCALRGLCHAGDAEGLVLPEAEPETAII